MTNSILVKTFSPPVIDYKEILRYLGTKEPTSQLSELINSCLSELEEKLVFKVCYKEFPIKNKSETFDLEFIKTSSSDLKKNLKFCHKIILFAATVGIELDRLISKYSHISPAKALVFQAIGAERIESLCNAFNREITENAKKEGLFTAPRFSPGYGDFNIEIQKEIFKVLDCPRKIGLSLNSSFLMTPSKSVTAIIGIGDKKCKEADGCITCNKYDCAYRRNK